MISALVMAHDLGQILYLANMVSLKYVSGYNTKLFTARGDIIQELKRNPSEVVDIQSFQTRDDTILCELNGKTINFYKLRS